jgi:hypothetical protein
MKKLKIKILFNFIYFKHFYFFLFFLYSGQLMVKKKNYFTKGSWPNLEEVIAFLELE